MKLIEYRIFMPLTIEENLIGQLWSFAEVSRTNTGGGEGVKIAKNEVYEVTYDENGRVIFDNLPYYESYETQSSSNSELSSNSSSKMLFPSFSSKNNENNSKSNGASKVFKSVFKKSISKENFKDSKNKEATASAAPTSVTDTSTSTNTNTLNIHHHERRKSLDTNDSSSALSTNSVEFSLKKNKTDANLKKSSSGNSTSDTTFNFNGIDHQDTENDHNDSTTINENDIDPYKKGQFTHKMYMIASKLPWFVRKLLSSSSTVIHERCWNMYPVVKTVITNDFFRSMARIELDTITKVCVNGVADENAHNLTPEQLEKREIVNIDIAEQVLPNDYKDDEDPSIFKSVKTGRGPLIKGEWINTQTPLICCYKLVMVEFKVFGLQTRAESYIKTMYKQLFTTFHRQIFCWIDKWHGLTLADVRKIEEDLAKLLLKKINEGELSKKSLGESD